MTDEMTDFTWMGPGHDLEYNGPTTTPRYRCKKCSLSPNVEVHQSDLKEICTEKTIKEAEERARKEALQPTCKHEVVNPYVIKWRYSNPPRPDTICDELQICATCDKHWTPEDMMAEFLTDDRVFLNSIDVAEDGKESEWQITAYVNCSDVFMWACADAEAFSKRDVIPIWQLCRKYPKYGHEIWCALKRKELPQGPVERAMRKAGEWPDEMEKLRQEFIKQYPDHPDCGNPNCKCAPMSKVDPDKVEYPNWPAPAVKP